MKKLISTLITGFLFVQMLWAQNQSIDTYQMKFQYADNNGEKKDTVLPKEFLVLWSKSGNYPQYVQWCNQPFAVLKSANGLGLFTDAATSFSQGTTVGYAFFKIASLGRFDMDYMESNIGSFVNNSSDPNIEVVVSTEGLIMKAKKNISPKTELTVSYKQILELFPSDKTAQRLIKYWK